MAQKQLAVIEASEPQVPFSYAAAQLLYSLCPVLNAKAELLELTGAPALTALLTFCCFQPGSFRRLYTQILDAATLLTAQDSQQPLVVCIDSLSVGCYPMCCGFCTKCKVSHVYPRQLLHLHV